MNAQDIKTLGQRLERELAGEEITDHEVASLLQLGTHRTGSSLYAAGHNASDATFKRIVRATKDAREDRELTNRIAGQAAK
jgi:hypothetical protein